MTVIKKGPFFKKNVINVLTSKTSYLNSSVPCITALIRYLGTL